MLKLDEQECTVTAVNVRAEMHGDSPVPGCDIGIRFETSCKVLDSFEKGLREAFYTDEEKASGQRRVPGTGREDELAGPRLRFNGTLGTLGIKKEGFGYKAELVWGDLASSIKIRMGDIKLTKIKADPKDGGTCGISLQLQCHPKEEHYGQLATLIEREGVKLTLTPPTADERRKIEKKMADEKKKGEGPEADGGDND